MKARLINPKEQAQKALELESKIAKIQWSKAQSRDKNKIYNLYSFEQLDKLLSNIDLKQQANILGLDTSYPVVVMQPSYIEALNGLFTNVDISDWQAYLYAKLLTHYAPILSDEFKNVIVNYEVERGFYEKEKDVQNVAVTYINEHLGNLAGRIYIDEYFDEAIKKDVTHIIKNIADEYELAISQSNRMSKLTKKKALDKLNKIKYQVGYPQEWQDYSNLKLASKQLVLNDKLISQYENKRDFNKLGKPIDTNDWGHPPQSVNAFYQPSSNSFVILAGILYPPFYNANGSLAEKYGGLGFVVGHEIGHGFDDQGSQFDGDGNMKNWWTDQDRAKFNKVKNALITQANAYEIFPNVYLNAELEIGEILGDKSGSEIAFRAFKKETRQSDSIDQKQAYRDFFKQLALTWRSKLRSDFQMMILESDPHPPSEYRANGIVNQFDEFYEVFDVQPTDPMYVKPEERITVWN